MAKTLKPGDHVEWSSHGVSVPGKVVKKVSSDEQFKGKARHASGAEPQYIVKSDKTDRTAMHKPSALKTSPKRSTAKKSKSR